MRQRCEVCSEELDEFEYLICTNCYEIDEEYTMLIPSLEEGYDMFDDWED